MAFTPKDWKDSPTTTTPLSAAAMEDLEERLAAYADSLMPSGALIATARSAAPTGYLLCDGSAVSRTTYKALFEAIGTTYGAGNGSTTFNVPDLRGRVPVGVDGAAGRVAANDALGNSSGAETHTLTRGQTPTSSHHNNNPGSTSGGGAAWLAPNVFGGGEAHNNMQPYQVVNYIIKT